MRWSKEQRAFAVEAYLSNGNSVITAQRQFRNRFNLATLAPVPNHKSIADWVKCFRETGSVVKKRPVGARPIRSPENIEAVRQSIAQSPQRSARKHAAALGLSSRSLRRILHDDLHLHPYKLAIGQELSERDFNSRINGCEAFLESVPDDAIVFFRGYLKSRVFNNRPRTLDDLKTNIREEVANIPVDMLERVMRNTRNRFVQCIDNGGRHLADMIFKTM